VTAHGNQPAAAPVLKKKPSPYAALNASPQITVMILVTACPKSLKRRMENGLPSSVLDRLHLPWPMIWPRLAMNAQFLKSYPNPAD